MKSLRFQSVFDIIWPVMIGPSSSHTAGAVQSKIVSSIFDLCPTEVEFQLFNSFAKTYRGHGQIQPVAGIFLRHGHRWSWNPKQPWNCSPQAWYQDCLDHSEDSNAPHPNTTKLLLKCPQDHQRGLYHRWWWKYSGNRTYGFLLLSLQYEYTDYHHCSSRYS